LAKLLASWLSDQEMHVLTGWIRRVIERGKL